MLLGQVSEEDKIRVYHSVDVFCAPNTGGESFGIVLAEAMAAGAPIVASDLDAFRRVLRGGARGRAVRQTGDAADLAAAVGRLLDQPELRAALSVGRVGGGARLRLAAWSARDVVRVYEAVRAAGAGDVAVTPMTPGRQRS